MIKLKKSILLLIFLFSMFSVSSVLAEETTVTAEDLNISEPTVLPTSPFYFLKEAGRNIQLLVTFDPVKKAETKLKFASEKLIEAEKVSADKDDLDNALSNYSKALESLKEYAVNLKQDGEESDVFLKKITVQLFNQQKLLDQIAEKQADSSQKIYESKEKALSSLTETSLSLASSEKVQEALEKAAEETKSGEINAVEVLKKVEEIVPEEAKKAIIEAQNRIIEKRAGNPGLSEEDKERLDNYLEELKTKKEYKEVVLEEYLEDLIEESEDVWEDLGDISEADKTKLIAYAKEVLSQEKIDYQEALKGLLALDISSEAKKIVDEIQSEIENRYSEGGINCLSVANPVCGKDNKNYNNVCEAKKAGVDIAYKGQCGTCIAEGKPLVKGKECCPGYKVCPQDAKGLCQKSCGESSSENTVCTTDWNPVCGENGKTYSNECFINKTGVKIKYKGECKKEENKDVDENGSSVEKTIVGMPNPAAVFCKNQGYEYEIRKNADGSEYGVCIFDEKNECDEWKFYRKECGKEHIKKGL